MTMIFQHISKEKAEIFQVYFSYVTLVLEIFWLFSVNFFMVNLGWEVRG